MLHVPVVVRKFVGDGGVALADAAYGKKTFENDAERVAFLFELHRKYTTLLPEPTKPKPTRKLR